MQESRINSFMLSSKEKSLLEKISSSYTEKSSRVDRAKIVLMYANNKTKSWISKTVCLNYTSVIKCINKAITLGIESSLEDLPRSGRPALIDESARIWIVEIACHSPKDFGYPYEMWTTSLLSSHIRKTCKEGGHKCLEKIGRGTISKILNSNELKPHKMRSYLDNHDPKFEEKQKEVLLFYKKVEDIIKENNDEKGQYISYDEKPGIQAIENKYPDIMPKKERKYPKRSRIHKTWDS